MLIDHSWHVLIIATLHSTTTRHNRFTALFPGPPGWASARRELLDFMVQGKINRGRHTDNPAGRHSIRTNQCPPCIAGFKNDAKNCHLHTITQLCRAISVQLRHISTIGENLLNSNIFSTCPHNMVNFGPLGAEISSVVWAPKWISMGFASWLHYCSDGAHQRPTRLWRWTEGATYIRQYGHRVGHWPTF